MTPTSRTLSLAACIGIAAGAASAADIDTSFEFFDDSGEFTLGDAPNTATFTNGIAQSIGVPPLYNSGLNSWMVDEGQTGVITFGTPVRDLVLFTREQNTASQGRIVVSDTLGKTVLDQDLVTSFVEVTLEIPPTDAPIGRVDLINAGDDGYVVIDDFTACVESAGGGGPLDDPIPEPIEVGGVEARLVTIADGLTAPNYGTTAPGLDDRLFVVDQTGRVYNINLNDLSSSLFLDVSDDLVELGVAGPNSFDERGLLGLAFHPDYNTMGAPGYGKFYTYESHPDEAEPDFSTMPMDADPDHQSVIIERRVVDASAGEPTVMAGSERELLRIDQPQFNHDAGTVAFSPLDGLMYISLGDGGAGDDQGVGHAPLPEGNGQTPSNILGNVLRINPLGSDAANGQYGIPGDNPFVNSPGALDEIFAYGLRNPFRFSFDRMTGELWLADAGQNDIEEVDIVESGDNLGWPVKEGSFLFDPNGGDPGFVSQNSPGFPPGLVDPVLQYDHDEGVVVIGGFVQRDGVHPDLDGRYVFGEFRGPSGNGRIFHAVADGTIVELDVGDDLDGGKRIFGFGENASGSLYAMVNTTGTPFGDSGEVLLIAPDCPADFAPPFGLLDLDDVTAFINAFNNQNESADLAPPFGLFDLDDIAAFVNAFNDVCP